MINPRNLAPTKDNMRLRIAELEAEVDRLRLQVAELTQQLHDCLPHSASGPNLRKQLEAEKNRCYPLGGVGGINLRRKRNQR